LPRHPDRHRTALTLRLRIPEPQSLWFPNLDWGSNPILSGLSSITDPYLNLFRGLIPPLGGIDLSALVAFLALNLAQSLLEQGKMLLASSGLG